MSEREREGGGVRGKRSETEIERHYEAEIERYTEKE